MQSSTSEGLIHFHNSYTILSTPFSGVIILSSNNTLLQALMSIVDDVSHLFNHKKLNYVDIYGTLVCKLFEI